MIAQPYVEATSLTTKKRKLFSNDNYLQENELSIYFGGVDLKILETYSSTGN